MDLQGAQTESRFRGIGRYSLSLAQAIARNLKGHELIIVLNGLFSDTIEPIRAAFNNLLPQRNIVVWYAPGPVSERKSGNEWRRKAAERIREAFLASLEPDIIHISSLFEGFVDDAVTSIGVFAENIPTVVTLYDLIPLINPDQYLTPNPQYHAYYYRKIAHLKRTTGLLGISESSCKEAQEFLGIPAPATINISGAPDPKFRQIQISREDQQILFYRFNIAKPFILYTGAADARKNLGRLIQAYAQLPIHLRTAYQLVITGRISEGELLSLQDKAKTLGLNRQELIFTGYITDADLIKLYNLCYVFVFPSWHEGFGLSVLEAMACGAPVISANTSSLPELMEREDALFDPFRVESMLAKLTQVLTNDTFHSELALHGIKQSKKFSWDESARRAIRAFEHFYEEQQCSKKPSCMPARRPRLAYISPLPPERSGIADYSAELLPELCRSYDIDVVTAQTEVTDPWIRSNYSIRNVQWFRQNADHYDRVLYHVGNALFHVHMFDLLRFYPGVVVLHDFFLSNISWYREMNGISPKAWVNDLYSSHGYKAVSERFHTQNMEDVVFKYPCNFSVLQNATGIIVHSEFSRHLANKWYGKGFGKDWVVVPILRTPTLSINKNEARTGLGFHENDFVVCSFGMVAPTKLNHSLLDAWLNSKLAKEPHCKLIFVGEKHSGDYGVQLDKKIKQSGLSERIKITGRVSSSLFRQYLAAADIAVQLRTLSRGETSGTVLDCMNYGLPTIVNAHGSMAELPNNAVWMLPDKFDDSELSFALETLWQDAEKRHLLGERAKEVIRTDHSPRVCSDKYVQAIESFYAKAQYGRHTLIKSIAGLENAPSKNTHLFTIATSIARTLPFKQPARQLLIDVSAISRHDLKTGIERVVRALLREWINVPPEGFRIEPVYFTDKGGTWHYRYARQYMLDLLNCPHDSIPDEPIESQIDDLLIVPDLTGGRVVEAEKTGVFRQLRNTGVSVYFVIYDLLPIEKPDWFPPGADMGHKAWLESVVRIADGAVCISRSLADKLYDWLKVHNPKRFHSFKIGWFHLGADVTSSFPTNGVPGNAKQVLSSLSTRPHSFLMVGTIEPRKGYLQTIGAFEQLWKSGLDSNLVIVGKEGWKHLPDNQRRTIPTIARKLRNHDELGKRLFWLKGISDEYLEKIYSASSCLIAASENEGFGLPIIEAARHGLPIIARDIPVFREVAGECAYYFSGLSTENLASAIKIWLDLFKSGKAPSSKDMPYLTWEQSAKNLLDIILNNKWYLIYTPDDFRRD